MGCRALLQGVFLTQGPHRCLFHPCAGERDLHRWHRPCFTRDLMEVKLHVPVCLCLACSSEYNVFKLHLCCSVGQNFLPFEA